MAIVAWRGQVRKASGTLGASCSEYDFNCWVFNVIDPSGDIIYIDPSQVIVPASFPLNLQGPLPCMYMCESPYDAVQAHMLALWNKYFNPTQVGKAVVKALRFRRAETATSFGIHPVPTHGCAIYDGHEYKYDAGSCISIRTALQTTNPVKATCPPGYQVVQHPDGSFGCNPIRGYTRPPTTVLPIQPVVPTQRGYLRPSPIIAR